MKQRILDVLSMFVMLAALALAAAILTPRAFAGMIPAEQAQPDDRSAVKAKLARPEVARQMQKMGIAPENATARVDAMSDEEVRQLAGRLDALPAGGTLSTQDTLLVIIIVLLIVIVL